jgi:hypothetical protein
MFWDSAGYLWIYGSGTLRCSDSVLNPPAVKISVNNDDRSEIRLGQAYPHPFTDAVSVHVTLPHSEYITLKVFDVLGNEIYTAAQGIYSGGEHRFDLNGKGMPRSGILQLVTTDGIRTQLLMRR